jgi:hypothetical protein
MLLKRKTTDNYFFKKVITSMKSGRPSPFFWNETIQQIKKGRIADIKRNKKKKKLTVEDDVSRRRGTIDHQIIIRGARNKKTIHKLRTGKFNMQ